MLCKYCNKEILEGSQFCSFCGKEMASQTTDTNKLIDKDNSNKAYTNSKNKKAIISIVICIVIVLFGSVGYILRNGILYSDEKKAKLIIHSYVRDGKSEALKLVKRYYPNDIEEQDSWLSFFVSRELDKIGGKPNKINSSTYEKIKNENNIKLDAKDVQYDMVNNLDKSFALQGMAELDDYYNYGFDDMEADYFCIGVSPVDGSYLDKWYIYLHRDSFKELYDILKEDRKEVILECEIPKYRYKKYMNNMAICEKAWW